MVVCCVGFLSSHMLFCSNKHDILKKVNVSFSLSNSLYYKPHEGFDNLMYIHVTPFLFKELIFNKSFYKNFAYLYSIFVSCSVHIKYFLLFGVLMCSCISVQINSFSCSVHLHVLWTDLCWESKGCSCSSALHHVGGKGLLLSCRGWISDVLFRGKVWFPSWELNSGVCQVLLQEKVDWRNLEWIFSFKYISQMDMWRCALLTVYMYREVRRKRGIEQIENPTGTHTGFHIRNTFPKCLKPFK